MAIFVHVAVPSVCRESFPLNLKEFSFKIRLNFFLKHLVPGLWGGEGSRHKKLRMFGIPLHTRTVVIPSF